jgi:hypothetical protein
MPRVLLGDKFYLSVAVMVLGIIILDTMLIWWSILTPSRLRPLQKRFADYPGRARIVPSTERTIGWSR